MHEDKTDDTWIASIVEEFSSPLLAYTIRFVGDRDRAKDVVQHAFVKLCRQNRADVEHTTKAWLYTVCRNRALDILRKEARMTAPSPRSANPLWRPILPWKDRKPRTSCSELCMDFL